jgi:hypothetical protein
MFSDEEKIKWFDLAVKFQLMGMIFLTMKSRQLTGATKWVIEDLSTHKVLNSNLDWEDELPLKQRDESYMIRTRFDFDTAIALYDQYKMVME